MRWQTVLKSIFFSSDFILSVLVVLGIAFFVRGNIPVTTAKEILSACVAILSIIFSVFFAALAIIITAGDNEFINFLEEDGSYTHIIWTFKFTLFLLFVSLIISISLYVTVLPHVELVAQSGMYYYYPKWLMLPFAFLAMWSLFAAFNSSLDAIKYAEYRARFISIMNATSDEAEELEESGE